MADIFKGLAAVAACLLGLYVVLHVAFSIPGVGSVVVFGVNVVSAVLGVVYSVPFLILVLIVSLIVWGLASLKGGNSPGDVGANQGAAGPATPEGSNGTSTPVAGSVNGKIKEAAVSFAKQKAQEFLRKRMSGR
jgi:hypothetical protein